MLQNGNFESDKPQIIIDKDNFEFSFSKTNNLRNNSNGKNNNNVMLQGNENKNIYGHVNDKKPNNFENKNAGLIYKLLNRNKNPCEKKIPFFSLINNMSKTNNITKPKLDINNKNQNSPKKNQDKLFYYKNTENKEHNNIGNAAKHETLFNAKNNNIKDEAKKEILEIFDIKEDVKLPYEIEYFLSNPKFNYDFEHQNDNNSNYQYVNENFIDILLNSFKRKMILDLNIKPIKEVQTEITFFKRNILISWMTEINFKYVKDQNILFTAIKYLDLILYSKKLNVNLNDFQLIGVVCFNLALKMENHHKVFNLDEMIALTGGGGENSREKNEIKKQIKKMEKKICDILNFELEISTTVLILRRLIQMLNIQNKRMEEIFCALSYFFLELSLYEEHFYELDDFVKALSSLILTKELLKKYYYQIGFHDYLMNCSKLKTKEIKFYYSLCIKVIKNLKTYKYGSVIFIKYQHKDFYNVLNNYLDPFIIECTQVTIRNI